jgi:hypothetical protein
MREVPLCRLATSHHLYFYTKWGGLDLDFTECGICRLRHPINTDIGNGRGREAGVQEADFNKPLRGFIPLGAFVSWMIYTYVLNQGQKGVQCLRDEVWLVSYIGQSTLCYMVNHHDVIKRT